MLKSNKNIVRSIKSISWLLLIVIAYTSIFSVKVNAETVEISGTAEITEVAEMPESTEFPESTEMPESAEMSETSDIAESKEINEITETVATIDNFSEITAETAEIAENVEMSSTAETTENAELSETAEVTETADTVAEIAEADETINIEKSTEASEIITGLSDTEDRGDIATASPSVENMASDTPDPAESICETEISVPLTESDSSITARTTNTGSATRYIVANSIIRSAPNGSIIVRPWRPLLATGTIQGVWFKFTYNGRTAYVAMSSTRTTNPPMTGYAKSTLNVRKTPGGTVIGTVIRGDQVKGVLVGSWVKFTYNGSTGYVYASLLQKNPAEQKYVYIKAGSNLRNKPDGQVIETLDLPIYVNAGVAGNWFFFQRNNVTNYVYNTNTQTTPLTVTGYLKGDTNARLSPDINGRIYDTLPIGSDISGTMNGNWVKCTAGQESLHSQTCYVHIGTLRKDPIIQVRYAKSDTNVRNYNNLKHIVGKMSRGEFIKGRVIGDYIIEQKTGIDVAVYRHILSATPIPYAGYAIPNTNVRNAPCGSVLGKYSQSTYVSGTWQGNWLKIQFQGKTGYIYHSQLRKNTPDQSVTNQTSFTGADGTVVEGTALTYGEMERFLALINQHRKNNGAAPLAYNYNWLAGGNIRAAEIAYNFSHTRPDGSHWTTAVQLENVTWKGENIAWGYPTVESVFEIWKNSPAHNDNMLNPNYNVVMFTGITSNYGYRTWATIFSRIEPW